MKLEFSDTNIEPIVGPYRLIIDLIKKLAEVEQDHVIHGYEISLDVTPKKKEVEKEEKKKLSMTDIVSMSNDEKNIKQRKLLFEALNSKVEEGWMDFWELATFIQLIIKMLCEIYTEDGISNLLGFDVVCAAKHKVATHSDLNEVLKILGYQYHVEEVNNNYKLYWN